jgi:hypothetical protein
MRRNPAKLQSNNFEIVAKGELTFSPLSFIIV